MSPSSRNVPLKLSDVRILNYKSIADSTVTIYDPLFVVGKNASGKSNLLDALDFVGDALINNPDSAFRDRGGISSVVTKPRGGDIAISLNFGNGWHYGFIIRQTSKARYRIVQEVCSTDRAHFERNLNRVVTSFSNAPKAQPDRLYLSLNSGLPQFHDIFQFLTRITIYSPDVIEMRRFQAPDDGARLEPDAWNYASVLRRLQYNNIRRKRRIERYLSAIYPAVFALRPIDAGPMESVQFLTAESDAKTRRQHRFFAQDMSDGTLRALGLLLAIFQAGKGDDFVPMIGLEEPETGLHPAATAVLYDAIREGSHLRQIIVTSHSPELLDRQDIQPDAILVSDVEGSHTRLRPLSDSSRSLIQAKLITPGELLRRDQLEVGDFSDER